MADPKIAGCKQPYHAAEPLAFAEASAFIDRCTKSTNRLAINALRTVIADLKTRGYASTAFGVVLGSGKSRPDLAAILRSHALIHAAEGEFFRRATLDAGEACHLSVKGSKERELWDLCAAQYVLGVEDLQSRMAAMGRAAGPPWTQDQKLATLAAWLASSGTGLKRVKRGLLQH
jgi:hypothetical protein